MSITNAEINYNCNGGSHSASITEAVGAHTLCSFSNNIGSGSGLTSNSELNLLLSEFILDTTTTKKSPSGTTIVRNYIDRASTILDSYIILVRGITAPSRGGDSYDGIIYPNDNLPIDSLRSSYGSSIQQETSQKTTEKIGKALIIGSTYSVIAVQDGGDRIFKIYNRGNLIESHVYSPYQQTIDQTLGASASDIASRYSNEAVRKSGYTLEEFLSAARSVGISFENAPSTENNFILFDNSGTLRECISAIASFFGYFWYSNGVSVKKLIRNLIRNS
jgi:hypothetical protein